MSKLIFTNTQNNTPIEPKVTQVINQNGGGILKFWKGSLDEYNALSTLDPDTVYIVEQNN